MKLDGIIHAFKRSLFEKPAQPATLAQIATLKNCANCGNTVAGNFCSFCGEKKIDKHDVTVRHFIAHFFHEFTHIDSKIIKTLRYILFKPGEVTLEYIRGKRAGYMNPIQTFIVVNLIYFLLVSLFSWSTLTTPLEYQMHGPFGGIIGRLVQGKLTQTGQPYNIYEKEFNEEIQVQAKTLVIVMVVMFSGLLYLVYFNKKRFFVEHITFSLNLYSFILLGLGVGLNLLASFINKFAGKQAIRYLNSELILGVAAILILFFYLFVSLKKVYGDSNVVNFIKTTIVISGFCLIIIIYRLLLFFTTFYGLKLSLH